MPKTSNCYAGLALFLKHSLDQIEQLSEIILAVNKGQVILDPAVATIIFTEKPVHSFLKLLTTRELETLGLLSKGYTNSGIAEALYIDVKTVEHHINSIYGRLKSEAGLDNKHLRVSATRLYLESKGELVSTEITEGSLVPV